MKAMTNILAALCALVLGTCHGAESANVLWTRPLLKGYDRYIGWPTAYRTSKGEILAVFSGDRDAHVCPHGKVQLTRSTDNGETWSQAETVCNGPIDDRDAGVIELANGDLVLFWFTSLAFHEYRDVAKAHPEYEKIYDALPDDAKRRALGSWARRSTDGGRTWSEPVRVPVMTPHGGKLLRDGRILVVGVHGRQVEGMLKTDPGQPPDTLRVAESTDGGRSFRTIGQIPLGTLKPHWSLGEPTFYESRDGTLTALVRYELAPDGTWGNDKAYPRYMLRSESTDGGRTWSEARFSNLDGFPPHVLRLADGRLLCSYASRTVGRRGIYAALSADDGRTWDAAHEITLARSETDDIGYPSTVENPDGTLLTVYYAYPEKGRPAALVGTKWRLADGSAAVDLPLRVDIPASAFSLTDCALRGMKGLKGRQAVMLNSDRGFVRNSRGYAEAAFVAPTSGWYRVEVRCAAKCRTPLEIWVNDFDKVVLDCPASNLQKFGPRAFTHRFPAGRNVLRLLGPGSAYHVAVERMRIEGPVAEPPKPPPSGAAVAAAAAKVDAEFAGRTVTVPRTVTYLEPPKAAEPFKVAIDRVEPENTVVYYSGTVSPKAEDAAVEVTYRVTGPDGASALTKPVRVLVKGLGETRRTFVNPLGDGADPFVNRIDGWYYHIQAKHGKERASLYLRRTRSFIDYGSAKPVRIHTFGPYSEETHTSEVWGWFPIIKWTDGHYYVFYAASRRHDTASHRMFVLKSKKPDDPLSGYEELGMLDTGGVWAIGLNYFQWKGRYYAVWSGWRKQDRVHLPQCSYLARMENPWTIGPRVEISAPTLPWEGLDAGTPIQEGAMVYEVDGKLVMLYSANASFSNRYAIGMLVYVGGDTEADLLNPANWVKRPEPFLSGTDAVLAPGVPGLTQSPDGKEWWLLYHVAKYDGAGWCRQVMAQVVGTDEKGLPHVRKPASYYVPMYLPSGDGFTPPARTILDASRAVPGGRAASLREPFSAYGRAVRLAENGDTATYRFEAAEEGLQEAVVRFACFAPESALGLSVNGGAATAHACRYLGPEDYYEFRTKVALKRGANELVLSHLRGGAVKVDLVVLGPVR